MNKQTNSRVGFQVKSIADTMQANSESRTISGYAAIFGNKDRDGDILLRGCFAKSIADRGADSNAKGKIMFLWQHDHAQPLGRITKLQEDEKGLYFEAELDTIDIADRALTQLESGTLNQFSIGFSYVADAVRHDEEQDAWLVGEVKLYEISVVSIAANPETEYLGLKSFETKEQAEALLAAEVAAACKGLDINQQERVQRAVSRAIAMSASMPQEQAHTCAKSADAEQKGFFDFLQ